MLKTCLKCRIDYELSNFTKDRTRADGLRVYCRACNKLWYQENASRLKRKQREYYYANYEKVREYQQQNYKKYQLNPNARKSRSEYKKRNPHKTRSYNAKRRQRTVPFSNLKLIEHVYWVASFLSDYLGVPHEVDHIIPLCHPKISGLHVHTNLQILTVTENRIKSNKYEVLDV